MAAGVRRRRDGGGARAPAPSAWPPPPPLGPPQASGRCPRPATLVVGARYPHQRRLAAELGATESLPADQLARAVRRRSRSLALGSLSGSGQRLTGGADVVLDCVGSAESIAQSLAMVRPRGRVVLVGHARRWSASTWPRCGTGRSRSSGAYAYGTEPAGPRGPGAHLRPGHRGGRAPPAPAGWCRPPTPSTASRRRWPTPAPPAAGAPSRSPSTCATTAAARPR